MRHPAKFYLLIMVVLTGFASAQVSVGTPPFGSFGGGPFDTINLGNLNVHFAIPVLHKAGRGLPFGYDLSYDSSIWYPVATSGTTQWTPTSNWGWTANTLAAFGNVSRATTSTKPIDFKCGGSFATEYTSTTTYTYIDSKGRTHPFPGSTYVTYESGACTSTTYGPTLTAVTTDGSGWTLHAPANQTAITVTTLSGVIVFSNFSVGSGSGFYQDTNGNELTANSSGQYFDTLSSTTPVLTQAGNGTPTSAVTYTYTPPNELCDQF
jgi:hypothetical protein